MFPLIFDILPLKFKRLIPKIIRFFPGDIMCQIIILGILCWVRSPPSNSDVNAGIYRTPSRYKHVSRHPGGHDCLLGPGGTHEKGIYFFKISMLTFGGVRYSLIVSSEWKHLNMEWLEEDPLLPFEMTYFQGRAVSCREDTSIYYTPLTGCRSPG